MRLYLILFVLGCGIATGLTYSLMNGRLSNAYAMVSTLEKEVSRKESELLGYTKYTSYLTIGKQSLAEQMKLLSATMVREESVTQVIEKSLLGLPSNGTVAIWYSVEYSFGFDLQPDSYDVQPTDSGIEIRVKKTGPSGNARSHQPALQDPCGRLVHRRTKCGAAFVRRSLANRQAARRGASLRSGCGRALRKALSCLPARFSRQATGR